MKFNRNVLNLSTFPHQMNIHTYLSIYGKTWYGNAQTRFIENEVIISKSYYI